MSINLEADSLFRERVMAKRLPNFGRKTPVRVYISGSWKIKFSVCFSPTALQI